MDLSNLLYSFDIACALELPNVDTDGYIKRIVTWANRATMRHGALLTFVADRRGEQYAPKAFEDKKRAEVRARRLGNVASTDQ